MTDNFVSFLHLLATAAWIGGALFIHLVLQPSAASIDPPQAGRLMATVAKRFSIAAGSSILVLLFTGYYKTPAGLLMDPSSDVGLMLFIKHLCILAVVVVGLVIGLVVVPRLRRAAPAAGEGPSEVFLVSQKRLKTLSTADTLLAMVIFYCAASLGI